MVYDVDGGCGGTAAAFDKGGDWEISRVFPNFLEEIESLIKPVVLVSARTGSARAPIAEPSDPTRVARGVSRRRTREPRTRRAASVAIAT